MINRRNKKVMDRLYNTLKKKVVTEKDRLYVANLLQQLNLYDELQDYKNDCKKDDDLSKLIQSYIPGVVKRYGVDERNSDSGSLADQFEYIADHM